MEAWPERPGLRFLIYWALRREKLCDPKLCPDSREDGSRCEKCPLDRMEAALQNSEAGQLLSRALELRAAIKMGVTVRLDDISVDEFQALLAIEEAQEQDERERDGSSISSRGVL